MSPVAHYRLSKRGWQWYPFSTVPPASRMEECVSALFYILLALTVISVVFISSVKCSQRRRRRRQRRANMPAQPSLLHRVILNPLGRLRQWFRDLSDESNDTAVVANTGEPAAAAVADAAAAAAAEPQQAMVNIVHPQPQRPEPARLLLHEAMFPHDSEWRRGTRLPPQKYPSPASSFAGRA